MPETEVTKLNDNNSNDFNIENKQKQQKEAINKQISTNQRNKTYQENLKQGEQNPSQKQQQQQSLNNKNASNNRNKTQASSGVETTPSSGPKIDTDLVNVANENRVILNVGGIRHETYKVRIFFSHLNISII